MLQRAFPDVRIVCGTVDEGLREMWLDGFEEGEGQSPADGRLAWVVEPGMGHIGGLFILGLGLTAADHLSRGSLLSLT